jgi:hypothetical protein
MIWAEMGSWFDITFINYFLLLEGFHKVMFKIRDPITKFKISALQEWQELLASYGNAF